jgi:hypothetical protein
MIFVYLAIAIFSGLICATVAKEKNRDPFGWFLLGFFFNLIALIGIIAVGKLEKEDKGSFLNTDVEPFHQDSYIYKIKPSNDDKEWGLIRDMILHYFDEKTKLKQNDRDMLYFAMNQISYIKVYPVKEDNGVFYIVESKNCGPLDDLKSICDVVESKLTEHLEIKKREERDKNDSVDVEKSQESNTDNINKLEKLSSMLEKGHITREEFDKQKSKLLN